MHEHVPASQKHTQFKTRTKTANLHPSPIFDGTASHYRQIILMCLFLEAHVHVLDGLDYQYRQ